MKKWKHIIFYLMAYALLIPAAHAAGSGTSFYQQLSKLIQQQDDTYYFHTMQLTVGSPVLLIDGKEQILDTVPEKRGEHIMIPIRSIAEAVGASVTFQSQTGSVYIVGVHGEEITFQLQGNTITFNGQSHSLDVPIYNNRGRTCLSSKMIAQALNFDVSWNQKTSTIIFTAPYQTARLLVHAETVNTKPLNAQTVLTDGAGLWVLQFSTPFQAKKALQTLVGQGIDVEPDLYVTASLNQTEVPTNPQEERKQAPLITSW